MIAAHYVEKKIEDIKKGKTTPEKAAKKLHPQAVREVVADKGYHSNDVVSTLKEDEYRSYISEPNRGRRKWNGQQEVQAAVYANRRRIKGARGQRLRKARAERVERSFAHSYETGGMRRLHLRHSNNILKRLLIHLCGFNLGLLMRKRVGVGTPRGLRGLIATLRRYLFGFLARLRPSPDLWDPIKKPSRPFAHSYCC